MLKIMFFNHVPLFFVEFLYSNLFFLFTFDLETSKNIKQ